MRRAASFLGALLLAGLALAGGPRAAHAQPSQPALVLPLPGEGVFRPAGFAWHPGDVPAALYRLEVARDADFADRVVNQEVARPEVPRTGFYCCNASWNPDCQWWDQGLLCDGCSNSCGRPTDVDFCATYPDICDPEVNRMLPDLHLRFRDAARVLQAGTTYFWRVTADPHGAAVVSVTQSFDVLGYQVPVGRATPVYPERLSVVVNPQVGITWSYPADKQGLTFHVQVDDQSDFSSPIFDQAGLAPDMDRALQGWMSPTSLAAGRYYWRVSVDRGGDEVFGDRVEFTLRDKAVSYNLHIQTEPAGGGYDMQIDGLATPERTLAWYEALPDSGTFRWEVTAVDPAGNTTTTASRTLQMNDIFAPPHPQVVYPADESVLIDPLPYFAWYPVQGAVGYALQVSTDRSFESDVHRIDLATNLVRAQAAWDLPFERRIYWRLSSLDAAGHTDWSTPLRFVLEPPAVTYLLEIDDEPGADFLDPWLRQDGIEDPFALPAQALPDAGGFRWRVRATDRAGNERVATPFSLLMQDTFAPPVPGLVAPLRDKEVLNPQVTFIWTSVLDPSGVVYRVELSTDPSFEAGPQLTVQPAAAGQAYATAPVGALQYGQEYYWRVRVAETRASPLETVTPVQRFLIQSKASRYRWELDEAGGDAFVTPLQRLERLTETVLDSAEPIPDQGAFVWRVTATDPAGNEAIAGPFGIAMVDQFPPPVPELLLPRPSEELLNPAVTFQWTDVYEPPPGVRYQVEVAPSSDFTGSRVYTAADPSQPWLVLADDQLTFGGTYWWRVTATEVRGGGGSTTSLPARFSLVAKEVTYRWALDAAVPVPDDDLPQLSEALTATQHEPERPIPDTGDFIWQVTARDLAGNETVGGPSTVHMLDTFAPPIVGLMHPLDRDATLNPDVTFSWTAVYDPAGVRYSVELATGSDFADVRTLVAADPSQPWLTAAAGDLSFGQQYYWRVVATEDRAGGRASVSLAWRFHVVDKTVQYRWELIADGGDFGSPLQARDDLTGPIMEPDQPLPEEGNYRWRVVATDLAGNSRPSATSLLQMHDQFAPPVPELLLPLPNEQVLNPAVTFTWTAVQDHNGVVYAVEVSGGADFAAPQRFEGADPSQPWLTVAAGALATGSPLWWRVVATEDRADGLSSVSLAQRFQIVPRTVSYLWELDHPGAQAFAIPLLTAGGLGTPVYVPELALPEEGTLVWRVTATDLAGNARVSAPFQIEMVDQFAPPAPALLLPLPEEQVINPEVTFVWAQVEDAAGVLYVLEVSTSSSFDGGLAHTATTTDPWHVVPADHPLTFGLEYWWRVRALEQRASPLESVSAVHHFRVVDKNVGYAFELDEAAPGDFADPLQRRPGLTDTWYEAEQELPETNNYLWRIRATDAAGNETIAAPFELHMEDRFAPPIPVLLTPSDSSELLNPAVTLSWTDVFDASGVAYTVQIATDTEFAGGLVYEAAGLAQPWHTVAANALDYGRQYYWRVSTSETRAGALTSVTAPFRFIVIDRSVAYTFELDEAVPGDFTTPLQLHAGLAVPLLDAPDELPEAGNLVWRVRAQDLAGNEATSGVFRIVMEDRFAPPLPELLAPAHDEALINPAVSFQWTGVTDANGVAYTLQVATSQDFDHGVVYSQAGLADPWHTAPDGVLQWGQTYWWRVVVSETRANPFVAYTEPQRFALLHRNATYRWEIDEAAEGNFLTPVQGSSELTALVHVPSEDLPDAGNFVWHVVAADQAGNEVTSAPFSLVMVDRFAPPVPELLIPEDSVQLVNPSVTFQWTDVVDPQGVRYTMEIGTTSDVARSLVLSRPGLDRTWTIIPGTALQFGVTYYWRVRARENRPDPAQRLESATEARPFRIVEPAVAYTWAFDELGGGFVDPILQTGGLNVPRHEPGEPGLPENGTFEWRVQATDLAGNERLSSTFVLRMVDAFAPPLPELVRPTAEEAVLNPQAAFEWTPVLDANGVEYELEIANDAAFAQPVYTRVGLHLPHWVVPAGNLQYGHSYFWRVRVRETRANPLEDVTPPQRFSITDKLVVYRWELDEAAPGDFLEPLQRSLVLAEPLYEPMEDLPEQGAFLWRIVAEDLAGNERASAPFGLSMVDTFAPPLPELLSPAPGAEVLNPAVTFQWTPVVDQYGVAYTVEIGASADFEDNVLASVGPVLEPWATLPPNSIDFGRRLYWRVRVTEQRPNPAESLADVTPARSFTVLPKLVSYTLELDEAAPGDFGTPLLVKTGVIDPLAVFDEAVPEEGAFVWRVVAQDLAGNERVSAPFDLVMEDTFAPDVPVLTFPIRNERVLNPAVTFQWTEVQDASGVAYTLEVSTAAFIDDEPGVQSQWEREPVVLLTGIRDPWVTVAPDALDFDQRYYWRVHTSEDRANPDDNRVSVSATAWFSVDTKDVAYLLEVDEADPGDFGTPLLSNARGVEPRHQFDEDLPETGALVWHVVATDRAGNQRSSAVWGLDMQDLFPPPLPELLWPPNDEEIINPGLAFVWAGVEDNSGVRYALEIGRNAEFAGGPLLTVADLADAATTIPNNVLTFGTTYYWRVQVRENRANPAENYVDVTPPYRFHLGSKEALYTFRITDAADMGGQVLVRRAALQPPTYALTDAEELPDEGTFYWQVTATDRAGHVRDSAIRQIRMEDQFPPPLPALLYPVGDVTVLQPALTFMWTGVEDMSAPVRYALEVFDTAGGAPLRILYRTGLSEPSYTLQAGEELEFGGHYEWSVTVTDGADHADTTARAQFGVSDKNCTYALTASHAGANLWQERTPELSYVTSPERAFEEAAVYTWNVVAHDRAGNEQPSSNGAFGFDLQDRFPPDAVSLLYPPADSDVVNPRVTLVWSEAHDPTPPLTYSVQVDDDQDFSSPVLEQAALDTSFVIPAAMLPDAVPLYWRVAASDGGGRAQWTEPGSFSVVALANTYRLEIVENGNFDSAQCRQCDDGQTEPCGLDAGECQAGVRTCVDGQWGACAGGSWPEAERCDGLDNDCDGRVDNGSMCAPCNDGEVMRCGVMTGECQSGWTYCANHQWGACQDVILAVAEECDGLDNDCDGATDEEAACTEVCLFDGTARRFAGLTDAVFETPPWEALEMDTPYNWRVFSVDKAGNEVLAGPWGFIIDELGMVRAGGLVAIYYDGTNFDQEITWRFEPGVDQPANSDGNAFGDFDTGLGADTFSVKWEGWVLADFDEDYTFYGTSDDGQRLFVRNETLFEDWNVRDGGAEEAQGTISLRAGWNYIRYEMFENLQGASARLEWESASTPRAIIPPDHLAVIGGDWDETPPTILDVVVEGITPDAAVLRFSADEDAAALVEFGPDAGYGQVVQGEDNANVRLTGLEPGRVYHYRVTVTDPFDNSTETQDRVFCTPRYVPGAPDDQVVEGQLWAEYHAGMSLQDLRFQRGEPTINQPALSDGNPRGDFGSGAGPDQFSINYTGILLIDKVGDYNLWASADDGQRLYIDEQRLVSDWHVHMPSLSVQNVTTPLDSSWHHVRYQYFDSVGDAFARVEIQGPDVINQALLPTAQLGYITPDFYRPKVCALVGANGECLASDPVTVEATRVDGELGCVAVAAAVVSDPIVYDCRDPEPTVDLNLVSPYLPLGANTVRWQATNRYGLTEQYQEQVLVVEHWAPEMAPPIGLVVEAESASGTPVVLPLPLALTDTCDPAPTHDYFLCADADGQPCHACFTDDDEANDGLHVAGQRNAACLCEPVPVRYPADRQPGEEAVGPTAVTVIGADASANCVSAEFAVTVVDTTPPSVDPGRPLRVECERQLGPDGEVAMAAFDIPSALVRDNATPEGWFLEPPNFACHAPADPDGVFASCEREVTVPRGPNTLGEHTVTYRATDQSGNEGLEDLTVTVADTLPPGLELVESPDGFVNTTARMVVSITDVCDEAPDLGFLVTMNPAVAACQQGCTSEGDCRADFDCVDTVCVSGEQREFVLICSQDSVYVVDVQGTDHADPVDPNVSTLSDRAFGIDRVAPSVSFPGLPDEGDPAQPSSLPVLFSGDVVSFNIRGEDTTGDVVSGFDTVEGRLSFMGDNAAQIALGAPEWTRTLHSSAHPLDAGLPPAGPPQVKNLRCAEDVVEGDVVICDALGDLDTSELVPGYYRLEVIGRDQAGNVGSTERWFAIMSWRLAVELTDARVVEILAGNPNPVVAMFLNQIHNNAAPTIAAIENEALLGNALLYTYDMVNGLNFAESQGVDTGDTRFWLTGSAYATVQGHYDATAEFIFPGDPDMSRANRRLGDARDDLDVESFLSSLLAQENALFFVNHAREPFSIFNSVSARNAAPRIMAMFTAYLDIPVANGQGAVGLVAAQQAEILQDALFDIILDPGRYDDRTVNEAYLELYSRLNDMSALLVAAQNEWVWVRNWQWPVGLQVRELVAIGIESVAFELGDDPWAPEDELLAVARRLYDRGIEFIDEREVDDALDIYIQARCLIYALYNRADFRPRASPQLDWACDPCVVAGDCPACMFEGGCP